MKWLLLCVQRWLRDEGYLSPDDPALIEVDDRFNSKVVEKYTVCSVEYCKGLPGVCSH